MKGQWIKSNPCWKLIVIEEPIMLKALRNKFLAPFSCPLTLCYQWIGDWVNLRGKPIWFQNLGRFFYPGASSLRFLNGGVLRILNIYSFQKWYPVCSAINVICMVKYEGCWPMGSVQTGRTLLQLCESPFKYLNEHPCYCRMEDMLDTYRIYCKISLKVGAWILNPHFVLKVPHLSHYCCAGDFFLGQSLKSYRSTVSQQVNEIKNLLQFLLISAHDRIPCNLVSN